jgi:pimeloyl-ACP methyl ester carboxylesterase
MHVFYLHGFASSPQSAKAARIAERLARHGLVLHRPDFNQPDFSSLTVTRMIEQTRRAIAERPPGPVVLIGSSLGGLVALFVAASGETGARVERLVLLAPALDFGASRLRALGPAGLAHWRDTDRLEVFHHAEGRLRTVRYALYEDARRYDPFALDLAQPTLIIQGRRDEAVDPAAVERFARGRSHVTLRWVDDDHQLLGSVPVVLDEIEAFLGFAPQRVSKEVEPWP